MQFGLANALFVVVYLDDILIYSEDPTQHVEHVLKVLGKLREYGLFCKPGGLSMDPSKVQTIQEWKPPVNVRGVQSFLGFVNFYRRFIRKYSEIAVPLFQLTRMDNKFLWTSACQSALETLKLALNSEPFLRHFDPSLPTVLETDASNGVISVVLSQVYTGSYSLKKLHPIAYFSRTMTPDEFNYS